MVAVASFPAQCPNTVSSIVDTQWSTSKLCKSYLNSRLLTRHFFTDGHIAALHYQYASDVDRGLYLAGASVTWQDFTEGALTAAVNAACAVVKRIGQTPAALAAKEAGEGEVTIKDGSPLNLSDDLYAYRFGEEARQAVRARVDEEAKGKKQAAGGTRAAGGGDDNGYIISHGEATAKLPVDLGNFEEDNGTNSLRPLSITQAVELARDGRSEELIGAWSSVDVAYMCRTHDYRLRSPACILGRLYFP
jgi:hypothetical protein